MQSPDPMLIHLPRGETATFEEMQSYGETLQRFVREQEDALPGVKDDRRHNEIVDYLLLLADSYNEQLRIFKIAENERQVALLLSMTRLVGG